ncbi:glycosyltransferase family 2 protein [Psychroflexus sediminis]|uniref:Glycosyltransferase, catalytic subunit of cellulose synthase and poly-beta-1,6-N-acetylglucosamine synthase n=1 Tax=Psychroflexus sediminis TaxID=470826 RepID=A0A1G7XC57_9FLAO|nr:glycosyltransferase family 2 protein [Psychroflexus sediminis]SDG81818.1 Glycosyltransferase, catalytic subunit of cellulose synthase and poly-beta-1,6-N-acetylglucosamine synthase [Psychroflexus sediminis]
MIDYFSTFLTWFEYFILVFMLSYILFFLVLAVSSYLAIDKNLRLKYDLPKDLMLKSNQVLGISVVVPAYNEGDIIVDNLKSFLSLQYPKFEVIVVNDGSEDETLDKLIKNFDLKKVDFYYDEKVKTRRVLGHYKSTNPVYDKLLVVDKINGGSKADASNAGVNSSRYPIFLCTDMDCILKNDTLTKLVLPFMVEKKRVIATGAGIRISNNCKIKEGTIEEVRFPKKMFPRFQELEYVRSFLFGRMAWSRMNALLLVSGALGMFDKKIFFEAGGYWNESFGEDFELITRMRKLMHDKKEKFAIRYIAESLCWTEVPSTTKLFVTQRSRWGRGLVQTLKVHRKMFFNPKYATTGILTFPFFVFFEFLVPILELLGVIIILCSLIFLEVNYDFMLYLLLAVFLFFQSITLISILIDEFIFKNYNNLKEILILIIMSIIEPLIYHPINTFSYLRGYWLFFTRKQPKWGDMKRNGSLTLDLNS